MNEETTTPPESSPEPVEEKVCELCGAPAPKGQRAFVNRRRVCLPCHEKVEAELQAEQAGAVSMPSSIAGALAGAMIGAVIWAVIAVVTDLEVGYVALAVGWLAGKGAVLGAAGKKGVPLQIAAVATSVFGLVLGKYFTVAHYIKLELEEVADLSYFDADLINVFVENIGEFFGMFDILWLVLAISIAWRVPMPTQVSMSRRRGA